MQFIAGATRGDESMGVGAESGSRETPRADSEQSSGHGDGAAPPGCAGHVPATQPQAHERSGPGGSGQLLGYSSLEPGKC